MNKYKINISKNKKELVKVIKLIANIPFNELAYKKVEKVIRQNPSQNNSLFSKSQIIYAYNKNIVKLTKNQIKNFSLNVKMKDVRTISGVTPVTVLTKPFPCPGKCIFCPNDTKMPKSYLVDEPGAQRALSNQFDPYTQVLNRLIALKNIGHNTSKVELIILGGTWSSYPKSYQIWFIKKCFDALNEYSSTKTNKFVKSTHGLSVDLKNIKSIDGENISQLNSYNTAVAKAINTHKHLSETETLKNLFIAQKINEGASAKCVGLSIETRPDEINIKEVKNIRILGATKVQLGVQSLNNKVLSLNKRGHTALQTKKAFSLLRQAGFKIQIHYMPNLYGSNPKEDIKDFAILFSNKSFKPDEIKLYPCSLIKSAELMRYYIKKLWKPYTKAQLLKVIVMSLKQVKPYCRVTRVIRDIPSNDIVMGNKLTNFRQIAESYISSKKIKILEIRSREIKNKDLSDVKPKLKIYKYKTSNSTEYFLQFVTTNNNILGFLRLSIPKNTTNKIFKELSNSVIIREIHVYGQSVNVGSKDTIKAQHKGYGKKLIKKAEKIALKNGFKKISVISSIGTRQYYNKQGYKLKKYYQVKNLK